MAVDITNNSAFFAGLGCVNICANVPHPCIPLFIQSVCSLNMTMAEILNTVPHCTFKTCERWSHTSLEGAIYNLPQDKYDLLVGASCEVSLL